MKAKEYVKTLIIAIAALFTSTGAFASPADELTYDKLTVQEGLLSRGANSLRYLKTVGRLNCIKTVARVDNVAVDISCYLGAAQPGEVYPNGDGEIYRALRSTQIELTRGSHYLHTMKSVGDLVCVKYSTPNIVIGFKCRLRTSSRQTARE